MTRSRETSIQFDCIIIPLGNKIINPVSIKKILNWWPAEHAAKVITQERYKNTTLDLDELIGHLFNRDKNTQLYPIMLVICYWFLAFAVIFSISHSYWKYQYRLSNSINLTHISIEKFFLVPTRSLHVKHKLPNLPFSFSWTQEEFCDYNLLSQSFFLFFFSSFVFRLVFAFDPNLNQNSDAYEESECVRKVFEQ